MANLNEKMTALADEIRVLSGTTETMGLDAMQSNVADANDTVDTQADLIAQIASALEGKAGGSGSNIEYEIITIPAGATSASYSLSAVTNACGSVTSYLELTTRDATYCAALSFNDNILRYVVDLGSYNSNDAFISTDSVLAYFNNGTITWDSGPVIIEPIQLLLINDPSKTPFPN